MPKISMKERVKPPLVRAWFDTVLNPLLQGLRAEAAVLVRGDYTWRAQGQRFASLLPVRSHIMVASWDNLDQFLSIYPELTPLIEDHDRKLEALHDRVAACHSFLAGSSSLRNLITATQPEQDSTDFTEVLAEYIVNGVTHLPNYYSTAEFWNVRAREFLGLRESHEFRPYFESIHAASEGFKLALDPLTMALMSVRNELSLEQGVPIVTGAVR